MTRNTVTSLVTCHPVNNEGLFLRNLLDLSCDETGIFPVHVNSNKSYA